MKTLSVPIFVLLLAAGCAHHEQTATSTEAITSDQSATSADASPADASASDSGATGAAAGHIRLAGDFALDRDFVVEQCAVSPPGDGLLAGYQMHAKDGDGTIQLLSVKLADYSKDGTYSPAVKSQAGAVAGAVTNGAMGPLTLQLERPNSHVPLSIQQMKSSKLDITITGTKGDAEFTNLESPALIEYMASGAKGTPPPDGAHGTLVSGSITWDCGKIDHINGAMNGAINGMFKKLIKP